MNHYVTLFDGTYMPQALALYRSMQRNCRPFKLLALCMDGAIVDTVRRWTDEREVVVVSRVDVETEELRKACLMRNIAEMCWTYAPQSLKLGLEEFGHNVRVTYIDADSFFFRSPMSVFVEIDDAPIAIPPHRFSPEKRDMARTNGIYNVNFVSFDVAQKEANECLDQWARDCIAWCSAKSEPENGRMGDQLYWNAYSSVWPVHAIRHPGLNLAPWNLNRWQIEAGPEGANAPILRGFDGIRRSIVMYHFHEFRWRGGDYYLTGYHVSEQARAWIYQPYIDVLRQVHEDLKR